MHISNLTEAEKLLEKYIPAVKELLGKDINLDRMIPLMKAVGNPEQKLKVIHVAGTSGKTSTCYYIAAQLHSLGYKVGLTVSPHIDSITERVQVNGLPISEKNFCLYLGQFLELITNIVEQPTYFEVLMAFAYWVFYKENVDYAVIETGLGGLLDGSNIAQRHDKVCVITDIGFDHMHILGNTIAEIAAQKAGIIHTGNVAFLYKQSHDVLLAVRERCEIVNASYNIVSGNDDVQTFWERNWYLATQVVMYIAERDSLSKSISIKAQDVYVPARMEHFKVGDKLVIMDGAHNAQKMHSFVAAFQTLYPGKKATVVLAMKKGKEHKDVLPLLLPITDTLIVTSFHVSQDIPTDSVDASILAELARVVGFRNVLEVAELHSAYKRALEIATEKLIITGSFYLLSSLRRTEDLVHLY